MMKKFFWIALGVTALRIIYLAVNHRDLDVEEAQYWSWSRALAWGYHSKPPMISWVIHFSTWIFGDSEWAIRFFSPIAYFFSAIFLYGAAKILFNEKIAFWSGLTILLLPGVTYSATIISTDPLLILFWSMAIYFFIQALSDPSLRARAKQSSSYFGLGSELDCFAGARNDGSFARARNDKTSGFFASLKIDKWVGCGVAIGLGLLSKYTMLLFFPCAALYVALSPQYWKIAKKPGIYLAILVSALIFAPNVIWNIQHHNPAVHHVIEHNINVHGVHLHFKSLGFFILTQFAIFGPILAAFLIVAVCRCRKISNSNAARFLLCFSMPILALILLEALLSRAYGNWAALVYAGGAILTVAYLWEQNLRTWLKFSNALHIVIALIFFGWELCIAYGLFAWPLAAAPNWRDFGAAVRQEQAQHPQAAYLVDNRELWSKTLYYGKVSRDDLFVWDPRQTVNWVDNPSNSAMLRGKDFILITRQANLPAKMQKSFKHCRRLTGFRVNQRLLMRQNAIYVYWLQDFLGYER